MGRTRRYLYAIPAALCVALGSAYPAMAQQADEEKGTLNLLFEDGFFYNDDRDYTTGWLISWTTAPSDTPDWAIEAARAVTLKADQLLPGANAEDAEELRAMLDDLRASVELRSENKIRDILREVEDLVFYLQDA